MGILYFILWITWLIIALCSIVVCIGQWNKYGGDRTTQMCTMITALIVFGFIALNIFH